MMDDIKIESNPLLWQMDGIDPAVGLEYTGNDAELYREVLTDYADSIEEQAAMIERAVTAKDIDTFTIEVHSLKSISRTIGALKLSDKAKELEEYGKRQEWVLIMEEIQGLLSAYRALYSIILPYCTRNEQKQEKKPMNREVVVELLSNLAVSLEEYDSDRAEKIISDLSKYDLTENFVLYMEKLISAIDKFDYATCREVVAQWRKEF